MAKQFTCPGCSRRGIYVVITTEANCAYRCKYCAWEYIVEPSIGEGDADKLKLLLESRRSMLITRKQAVFVSEEAWTWLVQTARRLGYVRGPRNAKGLSHFIDAISELEYLDVRPVQMQNSDQWYTGLSAMRLRNLTFAHDTAAHLVAVATFHGVHPYKRQRPILDGLRSRVRDGVQLYTASAYAGAVLEAIGLRWLVAASELPSAPTNLYQRASRAK